MPDSVAQDSLGSPTDAAARRRIARDRIEEPVAPRLRRAGALSALAGLLWPAQAALAAWLVAGWVSGVAGLDRALIAAGGFVALGAARAALERCAGGILFRAADEGLAAERAAVLKREARAPGPSGSAAVAALAAQKAQMLTPWITRYRVAAIRVAILPPAFLALTFWHSWAAGLVLLAAGPLIPLFMALVGMAAEDASRRQLGEIASMNELLMERLSAMLDVRLLGAGERVAEDFAARAEGLRARTMAVLRIAFLSSTVLELFSALGVAMVAVYVGFSLIGEIGFGTWGPPLTLGEGVFLLLLAPEFFQPLRDLAAAWHDRAAGFAVAEELAAQEAAPRAALLGSGGSAAPLPGAFSLRLDGAAAALPGEALALPDFTLAPGEGVALTGPSGSGKSTTLAAVAGLLPLAAGRIETCGVPLDDASADAWRARVAVLPQKPHFADRSLRDFLAPGAEADGADLAAALETADAAGVVARLGDGLEARLGERGGGVSGGEARRLMLARAVAKGGDLLLADEPTADLDPETAARVIRTLGRLKDRGVAMIVATHDPALVAVMDREVRVVGADGETGP